MVIAVKTSNSPHMYVFKTLYSISKFHTHVCVQDPVQYSISKFLYYYIPEFQVVFFMLFTAVLSKYFHSVVSNLLLCVIWLDVL